MNKILEDIAITFLMSVWVFFALILFLP